MWVYQVSTQQRTCQVQIRAGTVASTAPVWQRFVGEPFDNLLAWARRHESPVSVEHLREERNYNDGNAIPNKQ